MKNRTLAIDPGYDRIGFAIIEKDQSSYNLLYSNCFQPPKSKKIEDRYLSLGQEVNKVIKKYKPTFLAIEKVFFTKNQKTVLSVSEAKGVILYQASFLGLQIHEYTPPQIKVAVTGYGRSDKKQVEFMVSQLIKKDMSSQIDDEIDAIAVGITHLNTVKINPQQY